MTAIQVIAEIERLPPQERELVFLRVHEIEEATIPDSFLQGMEEATRGELLHIEAATLPQGLPSSLSFSSNGAA